MENSDNRLHDALNGVIRRSTGKPCDILRLTGVGGGSISRALIAEAEGEKWFVKLNEAGLPDMFEAEADGLRALGTCPAVRVPRVLGSGVCGRKSFLILEYLDLRPLNTRDEAIGTGRGLAELHRIEGENFGWHRNNFIGSTPQPNRRHPDWPEFFVAERLRPQLELAKRHGGRGSLIAGGERLADELPALFVDYRPAASLLHGDLWHGNAAVDENGRPVLFDPAVHHGDREADLAMAELFGGFPAAFHAAYREAWPLADGYPQRRTLYQLYHVLNHFNLFGGGYQEQAERMIRVLLAELG